MNTRPRTAATHFIAGVGVTAALLTVTACGSTGDTAATVTQPWTGVSPTGNALDLGVVVAGITDPTGENRDALTLVAPTDTDDRLSATCTTDGDTNAVHLVVDGWHITATEGAQTLTVDNPDRALPAADVDVTTPVDDLPESITWNDAGRVDITAAADTPIAWNTPGRLYIGATVTCTTA